MNGRQSRRGSDSMNEYANALKAPNGKTMAIVMGDVYQELIRDQDIVYIDGYGPFGSNGITSAVVFRILDGLSGVVPVHQLRSLWRGE